MNPIGRRLVVPRLRVNGHKTWTTLAQHADWIFCLVRTDPKAKAQSGISFLLIDMKAPGVTVRPIITIDGSHEINDVFLEDVHVPVANLIDEENKGWTYAKFLLGNERTSMAGTGRSKRDLERLKAIVRAESSAEDPWGRELAKDRGVQARDFIDDFCLSVPNGPDMGEIHSRHLSQRMTTL
jgi:alkylation response protein AidB-like acyl-CoA dehydrogenase